MHDLLSAARTLPYDDETQVVDVPLEARVVMHVQLLYGDGLKHRLLPDHSELACITDVIDRARVMIHPEKLDGIDYCPVCFTEPERNRARETMERRLTEIEPGYGLRVQVPSARVLPPRARSRRATRRYSVVPKLPKK